MTRSLVLIVGFGRSGTSALTGSLRELGLHVPQPEVRTNFTNPKGFGETQWVVERHYRWLRSANLTVQDARPQAWEMAREAMAKANANFELNPWLEEQFRKSNVLLIKDPRMSWFLPAWEMAAESTSASVGFITLVRHPAEIVRSAATHYADPGSPVHIVAGWVNMTLATEALTRNRARVFVPYASLIADSSEQVQRIASSLRLQQLSLRQEGSGSIGFIDSSLHRVRATWEDVEIPDRLRMIAEETWSLVSDVARDTKVPSARFEDLRDRYRDYYAECEGVAWSSVEAARGMPRRLRMQISPAVKKWVPASALEWARRNYARLPESRR